MATARIHLQQALPPICICCGEPATVQRREIFWLSTKMRTFGAGNQGLAQSMTEMAKTLQQIQGHNENQIWFNAPFCDKHSRRIKLQEMFRWSGCVTIPAMLVVVAIGALGLIIWPLKILAGLLFIIVAGAAITITVLSNIWAYNTPFVIGAGNNYVEFDLVHEKFAIAVTGKANTLERDSFWSWFLKAKLTGTLLKLGYGVVVVPILMFFLLCAGGGKGKVKPAGGNRKVIARSGGQNTGKKSNEPKPANVKAPEVSQLTPAVDAELHKIDIQQAANWKVRDESNDLPIDPGVSKFGVIEFQVGEKCLQLVGNKYKSGYPEVSSPVDFNRTFHRLHVLHATRGGSKDPRVADGTRAGTYRLTYSDGTTSDLPVLYGEHIRDHWNWDDSAPASNALVAWTGSNSLTKRWGSSLRLFHAALENPHPEREVVSVSVLAGSSKEIGLFCVAMTAEDR